MIVHVPHASTVIPPDWRHVCLLGDESLERELLAMTDAYTDDLFSVSGATAVQFPVSRLVVDPERFIDDTSEPMSARGMGVIYTHTSQRARLRHEPSTEERIALLSRFYEPHHAALTTAVEGALAADGSCLVLDAHSFASRALPYELDQDPRRPDICLGTDPFHTPPALVVLASNLFKSAGWSVDIDRPFAGALVPLRHYRTDSRVTALMVEVNRGLYMDERTGERGANYESVRATLQRVLQALSEFDCHSGHSRT